MTFGQILKTLRKSKGWTQQELAERVGVAKSTLAGYEIGNREPFIPVMIKIAAALEVSVDELLGLDFTTPTVNVQDLELNGAFDRAPDHIQKGIRVLLEPYMDQSTKLNAEPPTDINIKYQYTDNELVEVFKASKSEDNRAMRYMKIPKSLLERLRDAPDVTEL